MKIQINGSMYQTKGQEEGTSLNVHTDTERYDQITGEEKEGSVGRGYPRQW